VDIASECSFQRDSVTSAGSGVYLAPASSEGQVNTVSEANSQQDVCNLESRVRVTNCLSTG
jgi:hypothetical protein